MSTKQKTQLEKLLKNQVIDLKSPKNWHPLNEKSIFHKPFKKYLRTDLRSIFKSKNIQDPEMERREVVAQIFPFKINQHIIDIIDWTNYQSDPIFQLTFPQSNMITDNDFKIIKQLNDNNIDKDKIAEAISNIRSQKNPAPANQAANRPIIFEDDESYECDGLQHKYSKTCLMFHRNAQTCHAYCTYCFRFNQFVGKDKFLEQDTVNLHKYLRQHKEISDILV